MEEKQPENAKHNYQLNDNQQPKLFSPRHILKAIHVKTYDFLDSFHVNECFGYDSGRKVIKKITDMQIKNVFMQKNPQNIPLCNAITHKKRRPKPPYLYETKC